MRELLLLLDLNERVLHDLLPNVALLEYEDAGRVLAEHVHLAHRLLLHDVAPQELLVVVVEALGELSVEVEPVLRAFDGR